MGADDTDLAEWHRVAADEKAASVVELAPPAVERIVEIGCGSGAVLEALDRRGFGQAYWACEPTQTLYDAIPRDRINRLVEVAPVAFDGAFTDEPEFDLGLVVHVAEHLKAPAVLIAQALERCTYVIVEVPIESNALGSLRSRIKEMAGHERIENPSGHVQFFSRATARALVHHSGGIIVAERSYFPMAAVSASATRSYQRVVVRMARHSAFLGRRYYEHFAMLIRAASYEQWRGHYVAPR